MFLFGVINTSEDSLNTDSIARTAEEVAQRAHQLIVEGADGFDIGGQGSTDIAVEVDLEQEWERILPALEVLSGIGRPMSIDTFHPSLVRRAVGFGITHLNAADGMDAEAMWEVAAECELDIVVPFMIGNHPHRLRHSTGDPLEEMESFFEQRLNTAVRWGVRERCLLDPGTGFAPRQWNWDERYRYQKQVYSGLDRIRRFDLPLYIPLPWKDTPQHRELLDIVLGQSPEFGRAHYPAVIRAALAA